MEQQRNFFAEDLANYDFVLNPSFVRFTKLQNAGLIEDRNVHNRLVDRDLDNEYLREGGPNLLSGPDLLLTDKLYYVVDLEDHVQRFTPCLTEITGLTAQKRVLTRLDHQIANLPAGVNPDQLVQQRIDIQSKIMELSRDETF